jgi:hypothetical protein
VDKTNGTATLSGTPDSESDASYTFTITASNGVSPNAIQTFVLTVTQAPTFTSPASAGFSVNIPGSFIVEVRGNPVASITKTGLLPTGVSFTDNGDNTARIAGTPPAGSAGSYPITITAGNGIAPNATQSFALTVTTTPTPTPSPSPSPTPSPSPAATQLLNISTRLLTKTGDNVAIGGFIITGSGSKTVLIRGIGPSLAAFLSNPLKTRLLNCTKEVR